MIISTSEILRLMHKQEQEARETEERRGRLLLEHMEQTRAEYQRMVPIFGWETAMKLWRENSRRRFMEPGWNWLHPCYEGSSFAPLEKPKP